MQLIVSAMVYVQVLLTLLAMNRGIMRTFVCRCFTSTALLAMGSLNRAVFFEVSLDLARGSLDLEGRLVERSTAPTPL
jgi:hypothetical protein